MKTKLLIIDDEPKILRALRFLLEEHYEVFTAEGSKDAMEICRCEKIPMVLLDLSLKDESGFDVLKNLLSYDPKTLVIIMTGHSTLENSIKAIKMGAYYFITKPIDNEQLLLLLHTADDKKRMAEKINSLEGHVKKDIIGETAPIKNVLDIIERIKDTNATVLITGESGTGKELIAHKIHSSSNRAESPFIAINCAAMPGELLESELFGYKKGSFTGAYKDEKGIIRRAHQGTLLLDEIGEMDIRLQSKLLRFLQDKEVRRLGEASTEKMDVRIICITNKNLQNEVAKGNFREDLFYRINVINIEVPPLRERLDDLESLVLYFIEKYNIAFGRNIQGIAEEAFQELKKNPFQGNIRELENIIQRSVLLSTGDRIEIENLYMSPEDAKKTCDKDNEELLRIYPQESMKSIEKKVIIFALENHNNNRKWTAESLGISERALRYKIKEYNI